MEIRDRFTCTQCSGAFFGWVKTYRCCLLEKLLEKLAPFKKFRSSGKQNLKSGDIENLNSLLKFWVWESGRKIDPATGVSNIKIERHHELTFTLVAFPPFLTPDFAMGNMKSCCMWPNIPMYRVTCTSFEPWILNTCCYNYHDSDMTGHVSLYSSDAVCPVDLSGLRITNFFKFFVLTILAKQAKHKWSARARSHHCGWRRKEHTLALFRTLSIHTIEVRTRKSWGLSVQCSCTLLVIDIYTENMILLCERGAIRRSAGIFGSFHWTVFFFLVCALLGLMQLTLPVYPRP